MNLFKILVQYSKQVTDKVDQHCWNQSARALNALNEFHSASIQLSVSFTFSNSLSARLRCNPLQFSTSILLLRSKPRERSHNSSRIKVLNKQLNMWEEVEWRSLLTGGVTSATSEADPLSRGWYLKNCCLNEITSNRSALRKLSDSWNGQVCMVLFAVVVACAAGSSRSTVLDRRVRVTQGACATAATSPSPSPARSRTALPFATQHVASCHLTEQPALEHLENKSANSSRFHYFSQPQQTRVSP